MQYVESGTDVTPKRLRFGLWPALIATTLVATAVGWYVDRQRLQSTTDSLREKLAAASAAEFFQDERERALLQNVVVGDSLSSHPDLPVYVDYRIPFDNDRFPVIYKRCFGDGPPPCEKCELFLFDVMHGRQEGDSTGCVILVCCGAVMAIQSSGQIID